MLSALDLVLDDRLLSPVLMTRSGTASAKRLSCASVPGTSPWLGESTSTFSTTVIGIGCPPGVFGPASESEAL